MLTNIPHNWSQQLKENGHFAAKMVLDDTIKQWVKDQKYEKIDDYFLKITQKDAPLFNDFKQFCPIKDMEFIISLRDAENEWEEDGIWHDDGSRLLAFSLSLTLEHRSVKGGILEIRKKEQKKSLKIEPFAYGEIIIFATGKDSFEHKINQVTKNKRLIIAGWCR